MNRVPAKLNSDPIPWGPAHYVFDRHKWYPPHPDASRGYREA